MHKFSVFSRQYSDRSKKSVNCKLPTANSQKGFAPIAVLVVLVLGVTLGTYLTMQPTNFLPFADNGETDSDDGSSGFDGGSNESYDYGDPGNPGGFEDAGTDLDNDGQTADVDSNDSDPNNGAPSGDNTDGVTNDGQSFENQSAETQAAFEEAYGAGAAAAWANEHDREVETGHTADGRSIGADGKPEDPGGGGNDAAIAVAEDKVSAAQSALNSAIESGRSASDIQAGFANLEAALESLGTIQGWGAGMEVERSSTVANSLDFGQIVDGAFQENGLNFNPATGSWGVVGETGQYTTFGENGVFFTDGFGNVINIETTQEIPFGAETREVVGSIVSGAMADRAGNNPDAAAAASFQASFSVTGNAEHAGMAAYNTYVNRQQEVNADQWNSLSPQEQFSQASQAVQGYGGAVASLNPSSPSGPQETGTAPAEQPGGGAPAGGSGGTTGSTGSGSGGATSGSGTTSGVSSSGGAEHKQVTGDDGKVFDTYNVSSPVTSGQYAGGHVQVTSTYDPGQAGFAPSWTTSVQVADASGRVVANEPIPGEGIAMSAGQSLSAGQVSQALNQSGIGTSIVHSSGPGGIPSGGNPSEVTGSNSLPAATTGTIQDVGGSASVETRGNQGTKSNK